MYVLDTAELNKVLYEEGFKGDISEPVTDFEIDTPIEEPCTYGWTNL